MLPFRQTEQNETAIIHIHGFSGHTTETWGSFPAFLLGHSPLEDWDVYALGYPTGLTPDLLRHIWKADANLTTLAKKLRTQLQTSPLKQYGQFVLMAHSMGGLVAQRTVLHKGISNRCQGLFMFGTPSRGLKKAWLVRFFKRQFEDMSPNSSFIRGLRTDWNSSFGGSPPFHLVVAAGDQDEFVPRSSSLEPFPDDVQAVTTGGHLDIVKPFRPTHTSVRLVIDALTGATLPKGPLNSACLAVEQGKFHRAVRQFGNKALSELDPSDRVQYALALDRIGNRTEAVEMLRKSDPADPDVLGTLAGRLKRRWKTEGEVDDAGEALSLYQQAFEQSEADENHAQAYYHAINIAFFQRLHKENANEAERWAREALVHCDRDEEDSPGQNLWRAATRGEAHLQLRNVEDAVSEYRAAVITLPEPRQVLSIMGQAMDLAEELYNEQIQNRLLSVFRGEEGGDKH